MASQQWMQMMTWVLLDPHLPALHLLHMAGPVRGPQTPLIQRGGGKLLWVKHLGGLDEARNR